MDKTDLERRKELLIKFLKNSKLLPYILILIVIIIGICIRAQPLENFKDVTTGKYISMELDSEIFLRYAKYISEHDSLYEVDPLRSYPLGVSLKYLDIFTSYFVAYLHKFISIFAPSVTLEYVDIIFPLIATAILTLFLFLLLKKIFNWKVGLLAGLLLNLSPPFLFRSLSSDHDILIMMFCIISFYIYITAIEQSKIWKGILLGGLAGLITFLGIWSGGAAYIIFTVLGSYTLVGLLLNKLKKSYYLNYVSWIAVFSILLQISENYPLRGLLMNMMTLPAYFALFIILIDSIIFKINWKSNKINSFKNKIKEKLPEGVFCIIFGTILIFILTLVFLNQNLISSLLDQIKHNILEPLKFSRWVTTVAENRRPYVMDFFSQFGTVYMLAVLGGAILLFHKIVKPIKKYVVKLTIGFSLFLILFFFARSSSSSILNGENLFSRVLFVGSFIGFLIYIFYIFIKIWKEKSEYEILKELNEKYIIILLWFLIMFVGALSAVRFSFEFTPITAILASFCFIEICEYLWLRKESWVKICGLIIIGLILFSPFSFAYGIVIKYYDQTSAQAKYSGPGYNHQWQVAGKWVRENTPKDSVFAHWWDYGYWVQSGFDRATITDGGNMIGWWNYLMGRNVLTAQTLEEPLKFLYAHDANYLLIVNDEIGKYPAFSLIGSDENYDRFSTIPLLGLDPRTQETRNEVLYLYTGGFALDEDLIYKNEVFPKGSAGVAGIILPINEGKDNESKTELKIGQPTAVIFYRDKRVDIPIKCIFFNGAKKTFDKGIDACLMMVPTLSGNNMNPMGAVYYLSRKVKDSLFTRLYLFNEDSPYFKKVYDDENQMPIIVYNGRPIGPIKIWKLNYPVGMKLNSEEKNYYLRTDYPDQKLNVL